MTTHQIVYCNICNKPMTFNKNWSHCRDGGHVVYSAYDPNAGGSSGGSRDHRGGEVHFKVSANTSNGYTGYGVVDLPLDVDLCSKTCFRKWIRPFIYKVEAAYDKAKRDSDDRRRSLSRDRRSVEVHS